MDVPDVGPSPMLALVRCWSQERLASPFPAELAPGRHVWLQVLRGNVSLNGQSLNTSDGVAVSDERRLTIQAASDAEVMLFDLAQLFARLKCRSRGPARLARTTPQHEPVSATCCYLPRLRPSVLAVATPSSINREVTGSGTWLNV